MAKKVGHIVARPGRLLGDEPIAIPVAEDLETVPGIPIRDKAVSFFSREYPLENMALEESASADWARERRNAKSPEAKAFFGERQERLEPIVEWVRTSGDLLPSAEPTGEDVTDAIRQKALELGYGEVGFTRSDRHYVNQSRKTAMIMALSNAICLALEHVNGLKGRCCSALRFLSALDRTYGHAALWRPDNRTPNDDIDSKLLGRTRVTVADPQCGPRDSSLRT